MELAVKCLEMVLLSSRRYSKRSPFTVFRIYYFQGFVFICSAWGWNKVEHSVSSGRPWSQALHALVIALLISFYATVATSASCFATQPSMSILLTLNLLFCIEVSLPQDLFKGSFDTKWDLEVSTKMTTLIK